MRLNRIQHRQPAGHIAGFGQGQGQGQGLADERAGARAVLRQCCIQARDCSDGNENRDFNAAGFMTRRFASSNDLPIAEAERMFFWPLGRRPDDHPGPSDLDL